MFEGKKGRRIYKNKEDVELLADLAKKRGMEREILKVKVEDGKMAEKEGFTVHQDISIAASKPSTGETGWIIQKSGELNQSNLGKAIKITDKVKDTG